MNTVLLCLSLGVVLTVVFYFGLPGSLAHLGWKLSGVWTNPDGTLQVMIHAYNSCVQGHVVSAAFDQDHQKIVIGKKIMDNVQLKRSWRWSHGTYIDPFTQQQFSMRVKLVSDRVLKVHYLEPDSLEESVMKEEEWKLVNSL